MIIIFREWIGKWLVGLDLFNNDTRPSGHNSRPTQINVSQRYFHSLNNYSTLIILSTSRGLVEVNKLHHIRLVYGCHGNHQLGIMIPTHRCQRSLLRLAICYELNVTLHQGHE